MIINGNLTFHTLGSGELQNAIMEKLASDPTGSAGRIYYNTGTNSYRYYDGSAWQDFANGAGTGPIQSELDATQASMGYVNTDGTFDETTLNALGNVTGLTGSSDLVDALTQLDAAISAAAGVDTLGELTDVTLAGEAQNDFLVRGASVWQNQAPATARTSLGVEIGVDVQAFDADLSELAALTPTSGDVIYDNAGTWASAAPGATSGVQAYDAALDALSAVAGTGILVQTAADTFATRALVAGTGAEDGLSLTNANGVAGDITIGLDIAGMTAEAGTLSDTDRFPMYDGVNNVYATLSDIRTGVLASGGIALDDLSDVTITAAASSEFLTYNGSAWVDTTPADARTAMDVYSTTEADSNFVDAAGDTMSGQLNMGSNKIISVADPTSAQDAATKSYVDSVAAGLDPKNACLVATTADLGYTYSDVGSGASDGVGDTLTAPAVGAVSIDGVALDTVGQRVLVKDQTTTLQNGIYAVSTVGDGGNALVLTRATDFDGSPANEVSEGAYTFVEQGTTQEHNGYLVTGTAAASDGDIVVGVDPIIWTQASGAGSITAGVGLGQSGNTIFANLGAGIVELPSDEIGLDIESEGLILSLDGTPTTPDTTTAAKLRLLLDGSTLSKSASGLKVATGGITNTEVNGSAAIDFSKLAALTSGNILVGSAGNVATSVTMSGDVTINNLGETTIGAGVVENSMLVNSGFTINADTGTDEVISLGDTLLFTGGTAIGTVGTATDQVTINYDGGLNDQSDVTIASAAEGDLLVRDGTDFKNVHVQFVQDQTTAASTWTVTHNIGQQFVNVTVYDSSDNVIIPQTIVATSANVTTITFNTAIAGTAVVMGVPGAPSATV